MINILLIINICISLVNVVVMSYFVYKFFFKKIKMETGSFECDGTMFQHMKEIHMGDKLIL